MRDAFASCLPLVWAFVGTFCLAAEGVEPVEAIRPPIQTEAELNIVIARLQDERTRLVAIERLYESTRGRVMFTFGLVGPKDPLLERAAEALKLHSNLTIAEQAMRSDSTMLREWGLTQLSNADEETLEKWRYLIPLVRQLAYDDSEEVRWQAQRALRDQSDQQEFLTDVAASETSASNIMSIVGTGPGLSWRMNQHLVRLLNHRDPEVQRRTLFYIADTSNRAKVWQTYVTDEVIDRVFALSESSIEPVRRASVFALREVSKYDSKAAITRILEMADDSSVEVRIAVALSLREFQANPVVDAALKGLVQDESVGVRYYAISVLGAADYVEELQEIATGSDIKYSRYAARKLKQIGEEE